MLAQHPREAEAVEEAEGEDEDDARSPQVAGETAFSTPT